MSTHPRSRRRARVRRAQERRCRVEPAFDRSVGRSLALLAAKRGIGAVREQEPRHVERRILRSDYGARSRCDPPGALTESLLRAAAASAEGWFKIPIRNISRNTKDRPAIRRERGANVVVRQ